MRFMKRYAWIAGAFLIVVLLVIVEMTIITNASGYETKENVVFAKAHIDKNTVITEDMLELREVGIGSVHPDALGTLNAAISKMAGTDIEAGEMLLEAKLSFGERGIIEAEDKSKRLFSVEFDVDQANGWQLVDDQYVDIIYVPNNSEQRNQPYVAEGVKEVEGANGAETAEFADSTDGGDGAKSASATEALVPSASNVKVLKSIRIAGLIDEDGKLVNISKSIGAPRYISFEVTEEQAVFLAYAKRSGKLELSCIPGK